MHNLPLRTPTRPLAYLLALKICLLLACSQPAPAEDATKRFIDEQNAKHNGDYLATFPLHNPDSCLIRLQNEVPPQHQAWAALSIWYHLPRDRSEAIFRWLELYEKHYPHDTVSAFAQMVRGEFMADIGKCDSARLLLADARQRYLRLQRPLDASDADLLQGDCFLQENNPEKAIDSYSKVLELINSHDTTLSHRHAWVYGRISGAYQKHKNLEQAVLWQKKILYGDTSKLSESWKYRTTSAIYLSTCYAQLARFDSSLLMANLAVSIFRAHSKKPLPAELLYRLGFAYFKKGDCATALPFFRDAARRGTGEASSFMQNQIEQGIGETYFCLGKIDSAEIFVRKSLTTLDTGNLSAAHLRLAEIHVRRGAFRAAYAEAMESNRLFKIAFDLEKAAALSNFQARYETLAKERRIAELEAAHDISRLHSQMFGLTLLLVSTLSLGFFLRQRARRRILEQENQILEKDRTLLAQEKQLAEALAQIKTQELERSNASLKNTKEELDTTTRLLNLKNQLIEELEMRLHEQFAAPSDNLDGGQPRATTHEDLHRMKILTEADWVKFRERFEANFPGFLLRLKSGFPGLTAAETRLFLLCRMKFSTKEISETLGISPDSVYRSRNRLSKKLGLPETESLDRFIAGFQ